MGIKHAPTGNIVANNRQAKVYDFRRLMLAMPIGTVPWPIVPSKVVKAMVEIEQDGYGRERVASWKDDYE